MPPNPRQGAWAARLAHCEVALEVLLERQAVHIELGIGAVLACVSHQHNQGRSVGIAALHPINTSCPSNVHCGWHVCNEKDAPPTRGGGEEGGGENPSRQISRLCSPAPSQSCMSCVVAQFAWKAMTPGGGGIYLSAGGLDACPAAFLVDGRIEAVPRADGGCPPIWPLVLLQLLVAARPRQEAEASHVWAGVVLQYERQGFWTRKEQKLAQHDLELDILLAGSLAMLEAVVFPHHCPVHG